jgi:adenylate cyclase
MSCHTKLVRSLFVTDWKYKKMDNKIAYIFGNYYFNKGSDEFVFCVETNDHAAINKVKFNTLKSFVLKLKVKRFDCSICNTDYETCPHESGIEYDQLICEPLISDMDLEYIYSVPYYELSTITDMLVIINGGSENSIVWYGFPSKDKKTRMRNINTAKSRGWISQGAFNHISSAFSIVPNGIISFPPNPAYIIEQGYRLDFKTEYKIIDTKKGKKSHTDELYVAFRSQFDPERYRFQTIDNVEYAYDRFDRILIPVKKTYEMLNKITREKGGNLYCIIPKEDSIKNYVTKRRQEIEKSVKGSQEGYQFVDLSEDYLSQIEEKLTLKFVIMCIDMIGSTKMSMDLPNEKFNKIIKIFSREIALVVENYHGYVLKNVGDGVVIYFPIPPFWGMDDNALDCGVMIKFMIENAINSVFDNCGLPKISFRIGLDSGYVTVTSVGSELIKLHKDLIGKTLNITSKIQSVAEKNEILVGHNLFQRLHTSRRKLLHKFNPQKWNYSLSADNQPYQIYRLTDIEVRR